MSVYVLKFYIVTPPLPLPIPYRIHDPAGGAGALVPDANQVEAARVVGAVVLVHIGACAPSTQKQ